jgi:hypothetical protein
MHRRYRVLLLGALLPTLPVMAGTWGQENWGQMYWGTNTPTHPQAPTVASIVADGSDLLVTISDYAPGQDGWSTVISYTVNCGAVGTVMSDSSPVRVQGLDSDTQYECSVEAVNAFGSSPATVTLAATDPVLQGLNITIIRAALCGSDNPPAAC